MIDMKVAASEAYGDGGTQNEVNEERVKPVRKMEEVVIRVVNIDIRYTRWLS